MEFFTHSLGTFLVAFKGDFANSFGNRVDGVTFDFIVKGLSALIHQFMRFCLQACTSVSSKNKTTKIIDLFIKVDHIAMQYKQISLFCSFPDPA